MSREGIDENVGTRRCGRRRRAGDASLDVVVGSGAVSFTALARGVPAIDVLVGMLSDCARRRFSVRGRPTDSASALLKLVLIALNTSHSSPHFGMLGALDIPFAMSACKSCVDDRALCTRSRPSSSPSSSIPENRREPRFRRRSNRSINLASSNFANES